MSSSRFKKSKTSQTIQTTTHESIPTDALKNMATFLDLKSSCYGLRTACRHWRKISDFRLFTRTDPVTVPNDVATLHNAIDLHCYLLKKQCPATAAILSKNKFANDIVVAAGVGFILFLDPNTAAIKHVLTFYSLIQSSFLSSSSLSSSSLSSGS